MSIRVPIKKEWGDYLFFDGTRWICETETEKARIQERVRLINHDNILLELYMKKKMNPANFTALYRDETIDVDEFMENYVNSL
jgi:hypothetical protein